METTEPTGIRCGHCTGRHPTTADVRKCSETRRTGRRENDKILQSEDSPLTEKQAKFLGDLLDQLGLELEHDTPETIGYKAGQPIMSKLIEARRKKAMSQSYTIPPGTRLLPHPAKGRKSGERTPSQPNWPKVPAGFYAVPGKLLGFKRNDLYFYKVVIPDTGNWAGRTSVKTVVGGKPGFYLKRAEIRPVLEAIIKFGTKDASILYSQETRNCYMCNTHLTRKASRVMSIGPECAEKCGRGAEWRELDAAYGHANAEDDE
jgi:hypothetical protein